MESGHSWVCFFRDGAVGEGADGSEQPLLQGVQDEVTGDNSELVGSGHTAATPESKTEVADASRDDQYYSESTSCSTCFGSYSGRQGTTGAGAGPSGAVRGEDGDPKSGPRKGFTSLDGDGLGFRTGGNAGHHAVHDSVSDDEADSWIGVTAAGRAGSLSHTSNSSCVVEFNRRDRPSSQPGYGWSAGLRRNHVAAAGAADKAEMDRAFWETCLASGYP